MEVGSVMEVRENIETEVESEDSDDSIEDSDDSIEDMAAQEFEGDSLEDDLSPDTFTVSCRNARSRQQHVEYNWEEISWTVLRVRK